MYRLAVALSLAFSSASMADPVACNALRDSLPDSIGLFVLDGTTDHEPEHPGLGYSSSYSATDSKLTADFFDLRKTAFEDQFTKEVFDASVVAIALEADKHGATFQLDETTEIEDQDFAFDFLGLGRDSLGFGQFVAVGGTEDCVLRLRYSGPAEQESVRVFLDAMGSVNAALR